MQYTSAAKRMSSEGSFQTFTSPVELAAAVLVTPDIDARKELVNCWREEVELLARTVKWGRGETSFTVTAPPSKDTFTVTLPQMTSSIALNEPHWQSKPVVVDDYIFGGSGWEVASWVEI
ncbi:hypothetical protein GSI_02571 [Ganoderma sinense ZZ0214-1]|uniref:Uncharacterized protein n=1 Tax=Ganoderma sinense ZZ0214-1 TaxID=1077348 RepID=A0A2G8SLZ2_9APHY|nr:hypothetical protein GSI_02571 [Ganoderma sinense ZZ0214-1]